MKVTNLTCIITKQVEKIAAKTPLLLNALLRYYKNIVAREIFLGKISSKDRVLCIGGGPLPCTALKIAQSTGAKVQVIDNDLQSVECAQQVVKRLNMDHKIDVLCADGQKVDASKYSVIHVALQVREHEQTFENVWQKAPIGARILMRRSRKRLQATTMLCIKKQEKSAYEKIYSHYYRASTNRMASLVD